jgi:hypothetical protein
MSQWHPLDADRLADSDKPERRAALRKARLGDSKRDPADTHYADKTGHKGRGASARAELKPRDRLMRRGDPGYKGR